MLTDALNDTYTLAKYSGRTTYCYSFFYTETTNYDSEYSKSIGVLDDIKKNKYDIHFSAITDVTYNEESYLGQMAKKSGGIIKPYSEAGDSIILHLYPEGFDIHKTFTAIVGTGYNTITFKDTLLQNFIWYQQSKDHNIDAGSDMDSDNIKDWQEILFEYGPKEYTIDLSSPKNPKLKTFGELKKMIYDDDENLFYVERGLERLLTSTGEENDSIVSLNNTPILPIKSDPSSKDGDGDGITDYDDSHWNGIDTRYKIIKPLHTDTIESLYPELALDKWNGNNKTSNPVYLEINDNDIYIYAKVWINDFSNSGMIPKYTGDAIISSSGISYTPNVPDTKPMKELFIEGVEQSWLGKKHGNIYDFYEGITINIETKIEVIDNRKSIIY